MYGMTGVGAWSTVSVNVYHEEEEKERLKKAEEEEDRKLFKVKSEGGKSMLWGPGDDDEDNVMGVYDPNKTGIYRGFKIDNTASSAQQPSSSILPLAKAQEPRVELTKPGNERKNQLCIYFLPHISVPFIVIHHKCIIFLLCLFSHMLLCSGEKIGFKKRKGTGGGGIRQIKKKTDDD